MQRAAANESGTCTLDSLPVSRRTSVRFLTFGAVTPHPSAAPQVRSTEASRAASSRRIDRGVALQPLTLFFNECETVSDVFRCHDISTQHIKIKFSICARITPFESNEEALQSLLPV
jgi:hypothetical protein